MNINNLNNINDMNKHLIKIISKYVDNKLPYLDELLKKTEILLTFTIDEYHYQGKRIIDWGDEIEIIYDTITITRSDDKTYWTVM
jgi:hypothetical protein